MGKRFKRDIRRAALGSTTVALMFCAVPIRAQSASAAIDPEATAAMDRMSAALRSVTDVAFDADVTTEEVLSTGQKLQYGEKLSVVAHKPTGLKIVVTSDRKQREFYYNGNTLTIVSPRLHYYTSVAAPGSIAAMIDVAQTKYDLALPLADLFTWGTNEAIRNKVTSGYIIRPETIDGRSCTHFAFRQPNVDWQIWIEDGASARPCKLVITNTDDPAMPQYSAVFHWRDAGQIDPATFAYAPPSDAVKIAIADVSKGAAK